jgi:glycosyltransferase involved in cell wall biosynthesis
LLRFQVKTMDKITVIIPTRDRSGYLRQALNSVAAQTARDRIAQVLVSENGSTSESAVVCREFDALPITYLRQEPPLSATAHFELLLSVSDSPIIAVLHDDDWWSDSHVGDALRAMDSRVDCVATYSNHYETRSPDSYFQLPDRLWLTWLVTGCNFQRSIIMMSREETLLSGLLMGSVHYSTLVARRDVLRNAYSQAIGNNNDYDNDRTLAGCLAQYGTVAYLSRPDTFIRVHGERDSLKPELLAPDLEDPTIPLWQAKYIATTRRILQRDSELTLAAVKVFNRNVAEFAGSDLAMLRRLIFPKLREIYAQEFNFNMPLDSAEPRRFERSERDVDWFVRLVCPPLFLRLCQKLSARLLRSP